MEKPSLKDSIIQYLKEKRFPEFKGNIERAMYEKTGALGDTSARRLRELADDGIILKGEENGHTTYQYHWIKDQIEERQSRERKLTPLFN